MALKRILDHTITILVGAFFIFSGIIKVNDPIGTSIKLEEYFEVFASDFAGFFHAFTPFTLPMAVFLVVLEVVLGVAVLLRYRMRITVWVLLLLILFFTFLTFYSAYFNKVTDCGCFGDAIKLTPWQSFYKDVVLLVLIIYMFVIRKRFRPVVGHPASDVVMGVVTAILLSLSIYAIEHLPFIDFRAYHVGADIEASMSPSAPLKYKYIMSKDGEEHVFYEYPSDTTYDFENMILMNPEAQPKITDYNIWNDEGDFTERSFNGNKLFILVQDVHSADLSNMQDIQQLTKALADDMDIWAVTSNDEATFESFRHEYQLAIPYFYADATVLKAMIRANPGIMLLQDGVVKGKWHHNDTPEAEEVMQLLR